MTVTGHLDDKVHVPKEVKVTMKGAEVTVKGPKGEDSVLKIVKTY